MKFAVTWHVDFGASEPPTLHEVVTGNSDGLELETLATDTPAEPVFDSVMTTGAVLFAPTAVWGNASVGHVITNVDGVIAVDEGVVVLLEQPDITRMRKTHRTRTDELSQPTSSRRVTFQWRL
jgi:hypothetical protein